MTIVTAASSRAFIKQASLPPAPPRLSRRARGLTDTPPLELKASEAQSLVVGSGLIVAAKDVSTGTREDLINCTLFAQLAASGKVGSSVKVVEWYDAYFEALTALGWVQSDSRFEDYEFKSKNAETNKAVMKVLTVLLGPNAAALVVVKTVLDALQSMDENNPWITLFDRQSRVGKSARFQVATAEIDSGRLLQIALCAFDLTVKGTFTQVLFFRGSSNSTKLRYAAGKATIFEAALADQRAAISARLAAYRSAYVCQVKLGPV